MRLCTIMKLIFYLKYGFCFHSGGGIDSGLQLMDTGFIEVLKTSDETTLGTTYVAELIQVIETFVTAVGPETFQSINCDAANVQSKLNQLNTE